MSQLTRPLFEIELDLTLAEADLKDVERQIQVTTAPYLPMYQSTVTRLVKLGMEQSQHPEFTMRDLRATLGPFFFEEWVTKRGDDPLTYFLCDASMASMEFKRSGWFEVDGLSHFAAHMMDRLQQERSPHGVWMAALGVTKYANDDKKVAIAAVLALAHETLGEDLNHACGPLFLQALGL